MKTLQDSKETVEQKLMLSMMSSIETDPAVSQRKLSTQLGVAIGLVNTYLRRCIQKGWIKVQQIPSRRYAYYLTPKGFIEKTRLTAQYLSSSFEFFRNAQEQCLQLLEYCETKGWNRIILVGEGDLSKIAVQLMKGKNLELVTILNKEELLQEQKDSNQRFDYDAILITDIESPQITYDNLQKKYPKERLLTPDLLHVSRMRQFEEVVV